MLSDLAHEEIEEVDFLMEDIAEEIQDLSARRNVSDEMVDHNTISVVSGCK